MFDPATSAYQLVEDVPWAFGIHYRMGVDGLAMSLILLTTFLTPLCILASWGIEKQVASYMVLFLILETLMIGVFCAQDIIVFYFFFEAGLIPMFILIGVWGGARRVYAAFKFFLYTLLGSHPDAGGDRGHDLYRRHQQHPRAHGLRRQYRVRTQRCRYGSGWHFSPRSR